MTHFMRFAMIGAMVAGVSVYAWSQDDDFDALLEGLIDEPAVEEAADAPAEGEATPEETPAELPDAEATDAPAEEPAAEEAEAPAEEPAELPAEEPAEEPAEAPVEEPAAEEAEAEAPAEEPATDELVEAEDAAEEAIAEDAAAEEEAAAEEPAEAPAVEEDVVAEEPAEEPAVEEPAEVEAPAEEETEAPAEEPVAEVEPEAPVEEAVTEAAEEAIAEDAEEEVAADEAETAEAPAAEEPAPAPAEEDDLSTTALLPPADQPVPSVLSDEERKMNELATLEKLRQDGLDKHAYACLSRARQLMTTPPAQGGAIAQYDEAIKMYTDAKKFARQREANLPLRSECDVGIREAKYRQALSYFQDRDYKKALELAQQVQKEGHAFGAQLAAQIQAEVNRPADIRPMPELPEYATDTYKADRVKIAERLRKATVYFQIANYDEANNQIELILREDPNNEAAINLRARIGHRAAAREEDFKRATHAVLINEVNKNWTPRGALGMNSKELYDPTTSSSGAPVPIGPTAGEKESQVVMAKLNYIRLPEFTIRPPSTLADAVAMFSEMAKAYDKPELPPEEKGIAFVLNMGSKPPAAAEEGAEEDPFASDSSSSGGLDPIQNISMPWVTLKEALDMVCEVTGTKYVIKGKTVMIVPPTHVDGKMETRSYNVVSSVLEKVNTIGGELSSASSEGDGGWGDSSSSMDTSSGGDSESWKRLFKDMGVPFEGNASIVYLQSIGKLRVTNTPENLALVENILEELNVTPFQIEVEARFVEVSQADLNSLGFEWKLNNNIVGTVGSGLDWADSVISGGDGAVAGGTNANGNYVFRQNSASGTGDANVAMHGGSLNQGMRFLGDGSTYANRVNLGNSALAPNDEFATFSFVFGRVDMTMILHMLAQRTDTDMLSSPKLLVRPSQEAIIRVVTEWIYPTEFDITELEEANNYNNGDGDNVDMIKAPPVKFAVEPQSFEKQDVGVSLNVVPEVSQEGQMINILVNSKVVEHLGDFEYGMQVPYIQYDMNVAGMVTGAQVAYYRVSMPQPKFHFREISSLVSIYNGSTVVMGGLITERRNSFEDKVPFLGDLPFIGFLFRSRGEYSEKRNLLVFLTARLVDPAGRPLKTATDGRTGDAAIDRGQQSDTMAAASTTAE